MKFYLIRFQLMHITYISNYMSTISSVSAVQLFLTYRPFYKKTTTREALPIKWC